MKIARNNAHELNFKLYDLILGQNIIVIVK